MTTKQKLETLNAFFSSLGEASSSGNLSGYVDHYLPQGTLLLPQRPPVIGRQAIENFFENFRNKLELQLDEYEQLQVDFIGEVALVRSRSSGRFLINATGDKIPFVQNYLDILQYVDGRWLLSYHAISSANALPSIWDLEWEKNS